MTSPIIKPPSSVLYYTPLWYKPIITASSPLVKREFKIFEEVKKSLITPLPAVRQGLSNDYTD